LRVNGDDFLPYAHDNRGDVERFRRVLEPPSRDPPSFHFGKFHFAKFHFGEWTDQRILPGGHWRAQIEKALEQSRLGLLLVSPRFLASRLELLSRSC